ncbi:DUF1559 domain-containing protein, partial [Bremerella sp. JC817]|uniref:DUF1559 family PulG-like putative transporter n=1 Tax=Bremerella sp. JC817 TaxID=3231756 RepID=UPI00345991C9
LHHFPLLVGEQNLTLSSHRRTPFDGRCNANRCLAQAYNVRVLKQLLGNGRQNYNSDYAAARCLARSSFGINRDFYAIGSSQNQGKGVSSLHPGGVQVCMGDGSVNFMAETVNISTVFDPLCRRADGVVVGDY